MLDDELMNAYRNNDRLRTKNGVIITQRNKLMQQIKMHMAETEVILIITKTRLGIFETLSQTMKIHYT